MLIRVVSVAACAEDEEGDIASCDHTPFVRSDHTVARDFDHAIPVGTMDSAPAVSVDNLSDQSVHIVEDPWEVEKDENEGHDEKPHEAGLGRISGGDETMKLPSIAVEAIGQEACSEVQQ